MNRRALLQRAALLSLAAPTAPALAQGIDDPARANDAEVLNFALQLEELQAALYRAALELDDLGLACGASSASTPRTGASMSSS